MNTLMKDKNIVVMGVANKWSIAWSISEALINSGANVIFTYFGERSERSLKKLLSDTGIENPTLISCDVTSDDDLKRAFEQIGSEYKVIDGVVHAIAHSKKEELRGNYYDTTRDGYAMAQDISAYSLVAVCREAEPYMADGGSIVTLTYLGGEKVVLNYNVMGVAKAALDASVRYLAHDFGPKNIRVNAISAGPIKTLAARGVGNFDKLASGFEGKAPMRRLVTGEELGNSALFLLSHMSSGITGEILHVDCGFNILGY